MSTIGHGTTRHSRRIVPCRASTPCWRRGPGTTRTCTVVPAVAARWARRLGIPVPCRAGRRPPPPLPTPATLLRRASHCPSPHPRFCSMHQSPSSALRMGFSIDREGRNGGEELGYCYRGWIVTAFSRVVSRLTLWVEVPTQARHGSSGRVGTDPIGSGPGEVRVGFFRAVHRVADRTKPIWPSICRRACRLPLKE